MSALGIDIGGSSVKVALLGDKAPELARSEPYHAPDRDRLAAAIRESVDRLPLVPDAQTAVGLCLPGRRSPDGACIETAFNLPALQGWAFTDIVRTALGTAPRRLRVTSDIEAAARDIVDSRRLRGRVAVVAIGTGVGMTLLEDGCPCTIGSRGVGHIGQLDVGPIRGHDRAAPDGAVNTLESFVGLPALRERFNTDDNEAIARKLAGLPDDDPVVLALTRAMRTMHAIHAPDTIVLAGGVGMALRSLGAMLRDRVSDGLTTLANSDWSLSFADSLHHAALGAARIASGG